MTKTLCEIFKNDTPELTCDLKGDNDTINKAKYKSFQDIPTMTIAGYRVDTNWEYLEYTLEAWGESYGVELEPDFQRAHVWTEKQQTRYVEWILRGGRSGKELLWNCPGWQNTPTGPIVLVDGLQRVTAVQKFLRNELSAFGKTYSQYSGKLPFLRCNFSCHVNDLTSKKDVLQWYIDVNSGGTDHTDEEIARVKKLLKKAD